MYVYRKRINSSVVTFLPVISPGMVRAVSDDGEGDDYMGRAFLPLSVC